MQLPRLYQRQNGFLAAVAAAISVTGCVSDLPPVVVSVPDARLQTTTERRHEQGWAAP